MVSPYFEQYFVIPSPFVLGLGVNQKKNDAFLNK
jgi:hypothetical protein